MDSTVRPLKNNSVILNSSISSSYTPSLTGTKQPSHCTHGRSPFCAVLLFMYRQRETEMFFSNSFCINMRWWRRPASWQEDWWPTPDSHPIRSTGLLSAMRDVGMYEYVFLCWKLRVRPSVGLCKAMKQFTMIVNWIWMGPLYNELMVFYCFSVNSK